MWTVKAPFNNDMTRKTIEIPIMDEESYEKSLLMYVVIGEPRQIAGKLKHASLNIRYSGNFYILYLHIFIICRGKRRR